MISNGIAAAAVALVTAAQSTTPAQSSPAVTQPLGTTTVTVFRRDQQNPKNPFANVILTPAQIEVKVMVRTNPTPSTPQWTVDCGIKVIVVNPDIDPKMIISPPAGAPEPTIRRIAPPPCAERDEKE